jgi:hypothetical protein
MRLSPRLVPGWPKLAWVATFTRGSGTIEVLHGPMVETAEDWCVEAVWAGEFAEGDFDRTDLVFGTGVRCHDDHAVFVSSGSTLDRLWYIQDSGRCCVSNSLPALLAVTGLSLCEDHDYAEGFKSICEGLVNYKRSFPAQPGEIRLVYFNNLQYDGTGLAETEKPDVAPPFPSFSEYFGFLVGAAKALADNMNAPGRSHRPVPLASVSSGYDSTAAAIIAKYGGCADAVTFRQSTSLWRGSDSGADIAAQLGLSCREYDRTSETYPLEEAIWAVVGRPGVLNWTLFDYPEPLCCFFTGCHGDKVWDRTEEELPDPFAIPSVADLGIGEFRLLKGIFHCPVPFWGIRHVRDIRALAFAPEMAPWTIHNGYDRPIARRIAEEGGIARGTFAHRKKNTSTEAVFLWPHSRGAAESLAAYLRRQGLHVPSPALVRLLRHVTRLDQLVSDNLLARVRLDFKLRYKMRFRVNSLLFQWANSELKALYRQGLDSAEATIGRTRSSHCRDGPGNVVGQSGQGLPTSRRASGTSGRGSRV